MEYFDVKGTSLTIDPGIIIKMGPMNPRPIVLENGRSVDYGVPDWMNHTMVIFSDSSVNINGTKEEPVIFTSLYDDNHGSPTNTDTNLDGNATKARYDGNADWGMFGVDSSSNSSISYAEFYYG